MPPFEIIEHTADIGIRAFGASETEVFENAAIGMFSLISDLGKVGENEDFNIEIDLLYAHTREQKAKKYSYVSELLFRGQRDGSWGLTTTLERYSQKHLLRCEREALLVVSDSLFLS